MQNHDDYWKATNMTCKNKKLKRKLLTEIKNYKQRYTIYMLVCNITGNTYYGSTCMTLKERLNCHKCKKDCSSKIIIDKGDYLPLIPLETDLTYCKKKEREDYYITNNVCVNKKGENFNDDREKKYHIEYRKQNKEYNKQYKYWIRTNPIGILSRAYFD